MTLLTGGLGLPATALAQQAAGSFQGSCRNTQTAGGVLTAECADSAGRFHVSSIPYGQCRGDIGNNNGILTCNGAFATGGALVATDNNRGGRNNNDALTAGAVGAVVGALAGNALANRNQGSTLYAPGYAYPAYGDQGYGDPRFDPRYAEGGYAYGRPARQWVPIAERASWLDQRINRGIQEGTLDRSETRSLRSELSDLESLELRYRQRGMQSWMMTDLDRRFDQLASRIQYERTDGDDVRNQGAPELAEMEAHIRTAIREGVRDDLIPRDDARDLEGRLQDIQSRERRAYRRDGYRLSDYDRRMFRSELDQLDRMVDDIRDEP
jgi:hypothetical protein